MPCPTQGLLVRCAVASWWRALFVVLGLVPFTARSEPDVFGLGNGQHGALVVRSAGVVLNTATALSAPARPGDVTLTVQDSRGFSAGELVLVLQAVAEGPAPDTGTPSSLDVPATGAGRWELARLDSVTQGRLRLTAPLVSGQAAPGSQVVRVPEHTVVTVQSGASLQAAPWDGSTGGVLALLATGAVLNNGTVSADGAGFRGGDFVSMSTQPYGCAGFNQSFDTGGARKGEGLFSLVADAPTNGFGALANGAGGGNCHDSGGGGGGHVGAGGKGGFSILEDGSRDVGGRGGAALRYSALTRLLFGGGGGSAAGNSSTGTPGAAGGGILFLRATEVLGSGRFSANGLSASTSSTDGAGGGGAGGSVILRSAGRLDCASVSAAGGNGGGNSNAALHGPGGGGGGGLVWIQSSTGTCPTSVVAGAAGLPSAVSDGSTYGAGPASPTQPDAVGSAKVITPGFAVPAVPDWTRPIEGETNVDTLPLFEGTAEPGTLVHVFVDDTELGSAQTLPSGAFSFTPEEELRPGLHTARASAERLGVRSALSAPRTFNVSPHPKDGGVTGSGGIPEPRALTVGCGCGTSGVSGGAVLLALLGLGLRRATRAAPPPKPSAPRGAR